MARSKKATKAKESWEAECAPNPMYRFNVGVRFGDELEVFYVDAEEARTDCEELTFLRNTKKNEEVIASFKEWTYYIRDAKLRDSDMECKTSVAFPEGWGKVDGKDF